LDFKDYYATLGVDRQADADTLKRAYRKLARKYHPDVSHEPDAESRFKDVAEAHEALIDPERRAAYDDLARRRDAAAAAGSPFDAMPGAGSGYEFSGRGRSGAGPDAAAFSDFFESLFGRQGRTAAGPQRGRDHHARIELDLEDLFRASRHTISLRRPVVDAQGLSGVHDRQLEVAIPPGVQPGQQLRLAGQGEPGSADAPAGDLYLEIGLRPHPRFRRDGADLWFDLPVSPWEAALGARVPAPTPLGEVELAIPAGSQPGGRLRLKGRGLPGTRPGDLYAVLQVVLPPADTDAARDAYAALALAFATHDPRHAARA
jgi:curved DNA-binding protein